MKYSTILTIPSHPQYLTMLRAVIEKLGEIFEISDVIINEIKVALTEACTNVIRHAYGGDTEGEITLKFNITDSEFLVIIEDNGTKTEPEKVRGRDFEDLRPGGLGVHLVKRTFDVFDFDSERKEGNRLILIKNRVSS